jgi:hypothetical protein
MPFGGVAVPHGDEVERRTRSAGRNPRSIGDLGIIVEGRIPIGRPTTTPS